MTRLLTHTLVGHRRFLAAVARFFAGHVGAAVLLAITASAQPASVTEGLIAYYPFNGGTLDESGKGNNGVSFNVKSTEDRFNNPSSAFSFNGIDSYVDCGNPTAFNFGTGDFTLSAWIRCNGSQPGRYVLGKYGIPYQPLAYGLGTWDNSSAYSFITGADWPIELRSTLSLANSDWHHLVVVYQRNREMVLFQDSTVIDRVNISNSKNSAITNSYPLTIGKVVAGQHFGGEIDDVRIYNKALSEAEVKTLHDYESKPTIGNPRIATATSQVVNGFVVGANLLDGGFGYTNAPAVSITGGGGTGAKAVATWTGGVVTGLTIVHPGTGYTQAPIITIDPPPFPPRKATGIAQVVNGFVVGIQVTQGGFGYTNPPLVLLTGGGGSGAMAVASISNKVVTGITITDPGSGYTSTPSVRIAAPPFAPRVSIEVSKVLVRLNVMLGLKYQIYASNDLANWSPVGTPFVAQDEEMLQEFDIHQAGRYFRVSQVP